jgi:hypothetical protein
MRAFFRSDEVQLGKVLGDKPGGHAPLHHPGTLQDEAGRVRRSCSTATQRLWKTASCTRLPAFNRRNSRFVI